MALAPSGSLLSHQHADGVDRFYSYGPTDYPLTVVVGVEENGGAQSLPRAAAGYLVYALGVSLVVLFFGGLSARLLDRQYRISQDLRESQWRRSRIGQPDEVGSWRPCPTSCAPLNRHHGLRRLLRETSEGRTRSSPASSTRAANTCSIW